MLFLMVFSFYSDEQNFGDKLLAKCVEETKLDLILKANSKHTELFYRALRPKTLNEGFSEPHGLQGGNQSSNQTSLPLSSHCCSIIFLLVFLQYGLGCSFFDLCSFPARLSRRRTFFLSRSRLTACCSSMQSRLEFCSMLHETTSCMFQVLLSHQHTFFTILQSSAFFQMI